MKPSDIKQDIKELTREQLVEWFAEKGLRSFRAVQVLKWIYRHQIDTFDGMTNLAKPVRELLSRHFTNNRLLQKELVRSGDGSEKYLFELGDGNLIESVLIPEKDHYTLCISSQVGCAQGCRFCLTAESGLVRNLTTAEIISQVRDIQHMLKGAKRLSNIVLMGMGEPLANYRNVINALKIITDSDGGLSFSNRRVTLSTAGLVPYLASLGKDSRVNLAVSLNAADNATRSLLMPINRRYPLERLLQACAEYPLHNRRKITFEYILIKGVNDTMQDAVKLAELLRPIKAKINLIPFNDYAGSRFQRPDEAITLDFQEILYKRNYTAVIRHSKGQDISAACGQLRARAMKLEDQ